VLRYGDENEVTLEADEGDGLYYVELPAGNIDLNNGFASVVTLKASGEEKKYTFMCFAQRYSGMPSEVVEYLSMASQYTNGLNMSRVYGIEPVASLRGYLLNATTGELYYAPASLGNFGGYIVYR
jgi:hypothetical protein